MRLPSAVTFRHTSVFMRHALPVCTALFGLVLLAACSGQDDTTAMQAWIHTTKQQRPATASALPQETGTTAHAVATRDDMQEPADPFELAADASLQAANNISVEAAGTTAAPPALRLLGVVWQASQARAVLMVGTQTLQAKSGDILPDGAGRVDAVSDDDVRITTAQGTRRIHLESASETDDTPQQAPRPAGANT